MSCIKMLKSLKVIVYVFSLVGLSTCMNLDGASTGNFLDALTKSLQDNSNTVCNNPTANRTTPYFFGVTDLKCLNVEARLRDSGYNVTELRQKYPRIIGKRSTTHGLLPEDTSSKSGNRKRVERSPSRNTLRPVHRWIFYDGYFIEFGAGSGNIGISQNEHVYAELESKNDEQSLSNGNMQTLYPKNGDICHAKMESEVAGYSSVPLDCLYKCARSYVSKFGKYHLIKNNCHRFANKISDILCTGICPEWCI